MCQKLPMFMFFASFRPVTTIKTSKKYFNLVEEVLSFNLVGHMWKSIKNWLQEWIFSHKISHSISRSISHKISCSISHKISCRISCKISCSISHKISCRISCKISHSISCKISQAGCWLVSSPSPIPNSKFPPITVLLNGPTYHKSANVSLPPFPQISWKPQTNE